MATAKLTAREVEVAYRKRDLVFLNDGGGLYLRKQHSGNASWTLRYRFAGRDRWLSLGHYPGMPLAVARTEARKARLQIDLQQDPMALRRAAKVEARQRSSFGELCEDWYRSEVLARNLKHPGVPRRYIDRYLLPKLQREPAANITPTDIARLLDGIKATKPTVANDLLQFARRIFAFGVRRRMVLSNPVADFTPRLDGGGTERPRSRVLSVDELAQLFAAIRNEPSFGEDNLLAVRLLLALCVRKCELLGATWQEFDLDAIPGIGTGPVWRLPALRTKTGQPLDIPLVPEVVGWLTTLKTSAAGQPYVFPKRRGPRFARFAHVSPATLNVALRRAKHGLLHFTVHDLRRTARTHLAALCVRREVAEKCLGHSARGVEGTYDRYDYFKERREALLMWTNVVVTAERAYAIDVPAPLT